MIYKAIDIIRGELNQSGVNSNIGNISEILNDINNNGFGEDVAISLINIEENRISRDPNNYLRTGNGILKKNPAVHLYLTLLFTSVRRSGYQMALMDIQNVISFFQSKFVFDHGNTSFSGAEDIERLILDMVSLNLQQLHEIWSILGSRYFPSVVYRMRMVTIDSVTDIPGSLIKEVNTNYFKIEQS